MCCLVNKSRAAGIIYLSNSSQLPISAVRPAWLCHIELSDMLPQAICAESPADGEGWATARAFLLSHSCTPPSGCYRADMKMNFPVESLQGAWRSWKSRMATELPRWTRWAVAEGGCRDGCSEGVRKGSQGHSFGPLTGWAG